MRRKVVVGGKDIGRRVDEGGVTGLDGAGESVLCMTQGMLSGFESVVSFETDGFSS